jgi:hypothetical protein
VRPRVGPAWWPVEIVYFYFILFYAMSSKQQRPAKNAQPKRRRRNRAPAPQRIKTRVPRPQTTQPNPRRSYTGVQMSSCAQEYLHTLADPSSGIMGCIPSELPINSRKSRVFSRGVGQTCPNKFGFIIADPVNSAANDAACVYVSSGGGSLTSIDLGTAADFNVMFSNSDLTTGSFAQASPGAQMRVVGAMLIVRFTGTALNEGGTTHALVDPNHDCLVGRSVNDLDGNLTTQIFDFDRREIKLHYYPVAPNEIDFIAPVFLTGAAAVTPASSRFYMGCIFEAAAASQPFYYEFHVVHEFVGRDIRGTTPTTSDPNALAAATSVMAQVVPSSKSIAAIESSVFAKATSYLRSGISGVVQLTSLGRDVVSAYNDVTRSMQNMSLSNAKLLK